MPNESPSSVPLALKSVVLERHGFVHGFATRAGGVSPRPFDSLHFGPPRVDTVAGDEREGARDFDENMRRLASFVGFDPALVYQVHQVHGARVLRAAGDPRALRHEHADALLARPSPDAACAVGVRTADCAAVLLGDTDTGAVAAVHAGWRGVVAGVASAACGELAPVRAVVAAIGPCIGPCCFEVGAEVAAALVDATLDPAVCVRRTRGKAWVDLRRAVRIQLERAGVPPSAIDEVPGCTRCEPARFFSFRRDGARSGRHLAVIRVR